MTYVDSFSVRDGGVSVSFDDCINILIVLPSLDALSERVAEKIIREFDSRLSSFAAPCAMGLYERLRELREKFFTPAGRREVSSCLRLLDAVTVITMTPSTVLALTVIEADGDIVTRVNEDGAYAYHEELFKLHREAVKYATVAWRRRLIGIRDLVVLGAEMYKALLLVSIGSLIGSASAWGTSRVLTAAFLGIGFLSFLFSTFFNQFDLKARG